MSEYDKFEKQTLSRKTLPTEQKYVQFRLPGIESVCNFWNFGPCPSWFLSSASRPMGLLLLHLSVIRPCHQLSLYLLYQSFVKEPIVPELCQGLVPEQGVGQIFSKVSANLICMVNLNDLNVCCNKVVANRCHGAYIFTWVVTTQ